MRKTRLISFTELTQSTRGRRSLRNTQDPEREQLYEIPTKFRNRMPRPEPKASDVGKLSPMRRSMRLSGEGSEVLKLGSVTRKRRLQRIITPDKNGQEISVRANGLKSPKVENSQHMGNGNAASMRMPPLLQNGTRRRTRRRLDPMNFSKDDLGSQRRPIPISSSPKNRSLKTVSNSPLKQARFSPRRSRLSPTNHHTNGGSPGLDIKQSEKADNLSNAMRTSPNRRPKQFLEKNGTSDFENLSSCECENGCQSCNPEESDLKCKLCGKHRPIKMGKNGLVLHGPMDGITLVSRNLRRSTGRANALSSSLSTKYTRLPIAVEEATDKDETFDANASDPALERNQNLDQGHSSSRDQPNDPEILTTNAEKIKNESVQEKEPTEQALQSSCPRTKLSQNDANSPQEAQSSNHCPKVQETEPTQVQNGVLRGKDKETPTVNGFDSDIMDEFSCVDFDFLSDGEGCVSYNRKKRKMNLRSSGVRCDPNFYTLSLDLMIKRPRFKSSIYNFQNDVKASIEEQGKKASEDDRATSQESMPAQTESEDVDVGRLSEDVTEQAQLETIACEEKPRVMEESNETISSETTSAVIPSSLFTSSTLSRTPWHKVQPCKMKHPKGLTDAKLERSPDIKMVPKNPDEPQPLFTEDPPHGPDVYYFESDHVALKHNIDYHNLLRTVSLLESQRHRCLNDIKVFEAKKSEVILEPIEFVKKLQSKEPLAFPCWQSIPDLPDIEWSKYSSVYGTFGHVFSRELMSSPKKKFTRKVKINFETGVPLQPSSSSKDKSKIQGPRSQTFGVSWTVEEQRKLEELLIKYPSEENESRRYRKVAEELGSRTALQVQSRVQKYFIKLAKVGLPVPGTMPKLEKFRGRTRTRARPHPHHHLTKLSTFFPTFHCPVKMQDDERCTPVSNEDEEEEWDMGQDQVSDEEDVPEEMRYSDEYLEILRLKRIRREQLRVCDKTGQQAFAQHVGYECDMCNCDPIQGVRYHCIDCPSDEGVDLCQSCIRCHFETGNHKTSHRMEPVYKAEYFVDDDYLKFAPRSGEYNYLDPNFFPPKN